MTHIGGWDRYIKKRFLDVTLALYRVTDFLPKTESLRSHLREKADQIFELSLECVYRTRAEETMTVLESKIETITGYLHIAKHMNYVRPINFAILEREYDLLRSLMFRRDQSTEREKPENDSPIVPGGYVRKPHLLPPTSDAVPERIASKLKMRYKENSSPDPADTGVDSLNVRQKIILKKLQNTPHARISDFFTLFVDMSSKTIQRDLQDLVERRLLKKEGEKRWTMYSLLELR